MKCFKSMIYQEIPFTLTKNSRLTPTPTVPSGHRSNYRDASKSMSACICSLYSSDQRAPGFESVLLRGCGSGGVLLSLGDFRTPAFNLSVNRGVLGFGDGFELFMQLYVAPV